MQTWWHKSKYLRELYNSDDAEALFGKDLKGNHTPLGDVYKIEASEKWKAIYYHRQHVEAIFETKEDAEAFLKTLVIGDLDVLMFEI